MESLALTSTTNSPPDEGKLKRHYLSIFRRVMAAYEDAIAQQGSSGNSGSMGAAANDSTGNGGGIITMSPSDFICDVQTSALRTLSDHEYAYFRVLYIVRNPDLTDAWTTALEHASVLTGMKQRIQLKLGQAFKQRGVYPIGDYFAPLDAR